MARDLRAAPGRRQREGEINKSSGRANFSQPDSAAPGIKQVSPKVPLWSGGLHGTAPVPLPTGSLATKLGVAMKPGSGP